MSRRDNVGWVMGHHFHLRSYILTTVVYKCYDQLGYRVVDLGEPREIEMNN